MKLIRPITVTPAMLTACNVPETDQTAWSAATAYVVGDRCLYNHKIYYCLVNNTNAQPDINITGTTPKWLDEGCDNRWKMFDSVVGSQTALADSITLTLVPGVMFSSIAFLDLDASEIILSISEPVIGTFYSNTIQLADYSVIIDAYTYFFEEVDPSDSRVVMNIPPYSTSTINITINNIGGTAKVGTVIIGNPKELGGTQYNPTVSITDYSQKTTDAFGNTTVIERAYSKRMTAELFMDNSTIDSVQKTLASLRTTPVVWVGEDSGELAAMTIYGFYKSFSIAIPYPNNSTCSIEVEGLT